MAEAYHPPQGPLQGLRVVEVGHFIAAPFATRVLADLGAEVIKVEPPGSGDPARTWGARVDGRSLWWSVHARGKKSITLNLKHPEGRDVLLDLVRRADGLVENFRPGQFERWGISQSEIAARNPDCIVVHVSGFGQDGPYRDRASFGVIGEAIGGLRHLTGYPPEVADLPPVRSGVSLGDSVAGLYAVIGLLAAVYRRDVRRAGRGQEVDVALYEAVFSLLEGSLTEYGRLGLVRQPSGARIPTAAPTSAYRCRDGQWICIAGNSDRIFARLMTLIDRPDLAADPGLATNAGRLARADELDAAIGAWAARHDAPEAERLLDRHDVPAARIYTIADCAADPHFRARGMIREVEDPQLGPLLHPGAVPKFSAHPEDEAARAPGPPLGAHNAEIYGGLLGYSELRLDALRAEGVI